MNFNISRHYLAIISNLLCCRDDDFSQQILAEDFSKYAALVDDIDGINNYADACLALCKPVKNGES